MANKQIPIYLLRISTYRKKSSVEEDIAELYGSRLTGKSGMLLSHRLGLILSFVVFAMLIFASEIRAASAYRQAIEVNSTLALTDFQVLVTLDTASLVALGQMKADGGDIRITDSNGVTALPFWIETGSMNTIATKIWVRIPNIPINPPDPRKIIHLFYGDPSATSVANGSNTFLFFDDFSGGLGKWTIHKQPSAGSISIVSGYLQCGGGFTSGTYGHTVLGSVNTYNTFVDGIIEGLIYMTTGSIAEISYRGNYASNTGYKTRWDHRTGEGMGFLKPPYADATWKFWDSSGSGVVPTSKDGIGFATGYWFPFKIAVTGATVKIWQGPTLYTCTDLCTWSPPAPSTPVVSYYPGPGEISLQNHYGTYSRYDDIRVRRIASSEPTTFFRGRGSLSISRIDVPQSTVNQGQNGISVAMLIENLGDESVAFTGASLTFTLGSYTQTLTAPSVGTIIPGPGSITASFSVDVFADSPRGQATIDGAASGTDVLTGLVVADGSATVKGIWTIQKPSELVIDQIIASDTAYRGDVNRPVLITLRNAGEATAYWNSSTLQFSLGDYTAIYPQTAFPVTLLGGASATVAYGVDISPTSPVGTSAIDAEVAGADGNTLYPIVVSGALFPAQWHIPEEFLRTYQDAGHFSPSQNFNLPKVGFTYVYAQAESLTPFMEFIVRWLSPSGTEVASSNPAITSNGSGIVSHQYPLDLTSPTGDWTVRITNPLNTKTYCENHFQVVGGASLGILLLLPPLVSVGQTFSGTMTFINSGDTPLINAQPGTVATSGSGLATLITGPVPFLQDIPAHSQATFTWTWSAQSPGTFIFSGMGYGWDANSLERLIAPLQPGGGPCGLRADYYDDLNFTVAHLVRLDPTIDFNWGSGSPDTSMGPDTYTVRWTGWVVPEFSENYTFYTDTDDGVRLWVNGLPIINEWIDQGTTEWSGSISLTAGEKYPITMEFYENGGGAVAQLFWSSPSTPKAIVPADRLIPSSLIDVLQEAEIQVVGQGTGFYGYYFDNMNFNGSLLQRIDPVVNFDWGIDAPTPSMGVDTFSVRWSAWVIPKFSETYTFYTNTDDGARLWVDNTAIISDWHDKATDEVSGSIALSAGVRYPLTFEYYENAGGAVAELRWSSSSVTKKIIPEERAIPRPTFCVIQSPPNLSVLSVTATPTTVFRNQSDIDVEAVVQNSGDASAQIEAATLTFTLGNLTQTVSVPTLPQELPGYGASVTVKFKIGVNVLSPTGLSFFSCNVLSRDVNVPASLSWINGAAPNDSWTISQNGLTISAFPAYTPDQSTFNRGQTLYTTGFYRTPGLTGRIRFYDTQIAYTTPAPGGWVANNGPLTADGSGNLLTTYTILPTANLGTWTALVEDNGGTVMAIHHFRVQSMGNLVATLTLTPSEVYLGATFTAELSVNNRIVGGSTISPATPWPLKSTPASTGKATQVSGPTPPQGSIPSLSPGTFTWIFQATEETGTVGSFSLTASCSAVQTYRMPISITSGVTLTNHQVRLTVNTATLVGAGKMQADCDDIRFRDSDSQTDLSYWLESGANTAATILWVKVPSIQANIPKIIYLYYGNPAAVSGSDPNAVFEFFDHFTTLNPTIWDSAGTNSVAGSNLTITTGAVFTRATVSNQDGMAVEARVSWSNFTGYSGVAISNAQANQLNNAGSHKLLNLMTNNGGSTSVCARAANGTAASYNITNGTAQFTAAAGTNYIIGHAIYSGRVYVLQNHAVINSYAGTWTDSFYLWLGYITGAQAGGTDISDLVTDWVMVRKFVTPDPAFSIGSEEGITLNPLISGIDVSTGKATDSNSGISNGIRILRRSLALSSDVVDFGTIPCGDIRKIGNSTASNTGNGGLTMVRWEPMDLTASGGIILDKTNLFFFPDPVGAIPAGSRTPASFALFVPFSQASGTYVATMAIFDDVNGNLVRDLGVAGEPVDFFSVRVVVPETRKIKVVEDMVDLGNWEVGMTTSAKPIQAFNAGNKSLTDLEFKQVIGTNTFPIGVDPGHPGGLTKESFLFADVVATLTVGPAGEYIATWSLWDDTNGNHLIDAGEASDSFQVMIGVGLASLTILPSVLNMGICSPAAVINKQVNITNAGQVSLDHPTAVLHSLLDGMGNVVGSDQISLILPATIPQGNTRPATASVFVPSGTVAGTYTGIQRVFEDRDADGTWDSGEASAAFTLTVTVPPLRKIEVYSDAIDMGGIVPGTSKTLSLDCRNIGNVELTKLRWEKTNLEYDTEVLNALNASFPTSEPFAVSTGAFFNRDIRLSVPLAQASGTYYSIVPHYWLFNDDNIDAVRGVGETEDVFTVQCQVGSLTIDIQETTLSSVGDPAQPSTTISFFVKNVGEIPIINAKATGTVLIPVVPGPPNITSEAHVVSPVVIGAVSVGQTKSAAWHVMIPGGTAAATYSGTLTVWDDRDGDDLVDADEETDMVGLLLTVNTKRVIKVLQDPLDLGWTLSGTTVQGAFEVVNVGNTALTMATPLASEMRNLGNTIPAGNISFSLDPIGFMAAGTAKVATITLMVGWPRADGTYRGYQRIYDDYSGANGSYSANEESDLFELIVNVGCKKLSVTNPVAFGNQDPDQTVTQGFSVKNETTVPLTKVKWLLGHLESGANIIPVASLTFTPVGPFGVGGSTTRSCTAQIVLGQYLPVGNYIGTHTVWEDNNDDGIVQSSEASATFNMTVTVNGVSALNILNGSVNAGQVAAGSTSPWIEVFFANTGNVNLTGAGLTWNFSSLSDGLGHSVAAAALTASTTIVPNPLLPNQTGSAFFRIGPVPGGQVPGFYYGSPQTLTDGGTAADSCEFVCEIIIGGPRNLASGTIIQSIATSTFAGSSQRYFLSAFVCPGSGSAKLALIARDGANIDTTLTFGVEINAASVLTTYGSGIHSAGILKTVRPSSPGGYTWYRIFMAFDFAYDPDVASHTYLSLENSSPTTASHAVWFDGVQLERSVFPNQSHPTAFGTGKKIISPNRNSDLSGEKLYMEW